MLSVCHACVHSAVNTVSLQNKVMMKGAGAGQMEVPSHPLGKLYGVYLTFFSNFNMSKDRSKGGWNLPDCVIMVLNSLVKLK